MQIFSFFCGPGGLDTGFHKARAGFETAAATDVDEEALKTFKLNHSKAQTFQADLLTAETSEIVARCLRLKSNGKPIGVIGGPPCQAFSVSNVYQREDDPRRRLPEKYAAILKALNSEAGLSFFLFENVPGLLGHRHRARYEQFKKLFTDAGFKVWEALLDAQDYGVPQQRPRAFIIGINQKLHPGVEWKPPRKLKKHKTVRDAIEGLPEPVPFRKGITREDIPFHPNHWCLAPKSKKFSGKSDLTPGQAFGRSFRTLEWDEPSWTVAYGHREVHVHPNMKRRLSILEAMLLQSFPKNYELTGTLSAQIRLVSDAVPPDLAKAIAKSLARSLKL